MMLMSGDIPYWPDSDSRDAYNDFINETFIKYKGCMITRTKTGFKWNLNEYGTIEDAYSAVDTAMGSLSESLKRVRISVYDKSGQETILPDKYKSGYLTGKSPWEMYRDNQNQ